MESSKVLWVTLVKDQCRNGGMPKSLKKWEDRIGETRESVMSESPREEKVLERRETLTMSKFSKSSSETRTETIHSF